MDRQELQDRANIAQYCEELKGTIDKLRDERERALNAYEDEHRRATQLQERVTHLMAEVERLQREAYLLVKQIAQLHDRCARACEDPRDDCWCAGCTYAYEREIED
jgi:predicted nuclease with TOPRIM domain